MTELSVNDEAIRAWNGPLFERFVRFRPGAVESLGRHGTVALGVCRPQPGERGLDVGCGFGDASAEIAALVGPTGSVHGIDAAENFIESAQGEFGSENVTFAVADAQTDDLGGPYDLVFSRMGVMFFANPVAALRNMRSSLRPGGRYCAVVWRQKPDNGW